MPKTRDQRCQRVLQEFFRENIGDLYFNLHKLNVRGWKYARYEIIIPDKWIIKKPRYVAQTHSLIWDEETKTQDISPIRNKIQETENNFKTKFEPHEKKSGMNTLSSTRLYETHILDENEEPGIGRIIYRIMVEYYKDHIPFPENINVESRLEYLEQRNWNLQNQLSNIQNESERCIQHIRRRMNRAFRERDDANNHISQCGIHYQNQNAKYANSYRNIIRECYVKLEQKFECPVCCEDIEIKNIFITPCNHHICDGCSKQCKNSCPMCRQEMYYIPEETQL